MSVRAKICGITNVEDALMAVEAGADALGFIFYPASPRCVRPSEAAIIRRKLPPLVTCVGVFVNAPAPEIRRTIAETGIQVVQLHGDESPELCASLEVPVIKAFRVKDRQSLAPLPEYPVAGFLLDSFVAGQLGGTGAKFNWDLAIAAKVHQRPIILAGGLTPENIRDAVAKVHPYAVDVSSGVERAPGQKDPEKVRAFVRGAKQS